MTHKSVCSVSKGEKSRGALFRNWVGSREGQDTLLLCFPRAHAIARRKQTRSLFSLHQWGPVKSEKEKVVAKLIRL